MARTKVSVTAAPNALTYHPVYVRMLCAALRARGLDVPALLAQIGLREEDLSNASQSVASSTVLAFVQVAQSVCDDPLLAFEWGKNGRPSIHGMASAAILCSQDFRQVAYTLGRVALVRSTTSTFRVVEGPQETYIEYVDLLPEGKERDFQDRGMAVMITQLLHAVLDDHIRQVCVELPVPQEPWALGCAAFFPCPVQLGAQQLRFRFPNSLLDYPNPTADEAAREVALRQCHIEELQLDQRLHARISAYLAQQDGLLPTLAQVAKIFCLSERTASRVLQQEGFHFQQLLDDAQDRRAQHLLKESDSSVHAIAYQLGYMDPSNFIRAFRRWHGCTPQQYRQQNKSTGLESVLVRRELSPRKPPKAQDG